MKWLLIGALMCPLAGAGSPIEIQFLDGVARSESCSQRLALYLIRYTELSGVMRLGPILPAQWPQGYEGVSDGKLPQFRSTFLKTWSAADGEVPWLSSTAQRLVRDSRASGIALCLAGRGCGVIRKGERVLWIALPELLVSQFPRMGVPAEIEREPGISSTRGRRRNSARGMLNIDRSLPHILLAREPGASEGASIRWMKDFWREALRYFLHETFSEWIAGASDTHPYRDYFRRRHDLEDLYLIVAKHDLNVQLDVLLDTNTTGSALEKKAVRESWREIRRHDVLKNLAQELGWTRGELFEVVRTDFLEFFNLEKSH